MYFSSSSHFFFFYFTFPILFIFLYVVFLNLCLCFTFFLIHRLSSLFVSFIDSLYYCSCHICCFSSTLFHVICKIIAVAMLLFKLWPDCLQMESEKTVIEVLIQISTTKEKWRKRKKNCMALAHNIVYWVWKKHCSKIK